MLASVLHRGLWFTQLHCIAQGFPALQLDLLHDKLFLNCWMAEEELYSPEVIPNKSGYRILENYIEQKRSTLRFPWVLGLCYA